MALPAPKAASKINSAAKICKSVWLAAAADPMSSAAAMQNAIAALRRSEGPAKNDSSAASRMSPMLTDMTGSAVAVPRYPGRPRL